jgi:hypothetical protein
LLDKVGGKETSDEKGPAGSPSGHAKKKARGKKDAKK